MRTLCIRFKKPVMLVLAFLLAVCSFSACQKTQDDIIPEPTNKLVLYGELYTTDLLEYAINIFKQNFPDVEVEYRQFEGATDTEKITAYSEVLKSELPAGKGPDLILTQGGIFEDLYKTMDSNLFFNLDTLIKNDDSFNLEDYYTGVIDGGVYKNQRLFMPISFSVPILLTTEENLSSANISFDKNTTLASFTEKLAPFCENNKNNLNRYVFDVQGSGQNLLFPWCGVPVIDYENKSLKIEEGPFKSAVDLYKSLYEMDWNRYKRSQSPPIHGITGDRVKAVRNNQILFEYCTYSFTNSFIDDYAALLHGQTPVWIPFPTANNEVIANANMFAAIRKSSKNTANAYEFLKILLSEGAQASNLSFMDIPVLKSAAATVINKEVQRIAGVSTPDGSIVHEKIPRETVDRFYELLDSAVYCKNYSYTPLTFVWEAMTPYWENKKSYDDCLEDLKNKLELYINE